MEGRTVVAPRLACFARTVCPPFTCTTTATRGTGRIGIGDLALRARYTLGCVVWRIHESTRRARCAAGAIAISTSFTLASVVVYANCVCSVTHAALTRQGLGRDKTRRTTTLTRLFRCVAEVLVPSCAACLAGHRRFRVLDADSVTIAVLATAPQPPVLCGL